MTSPTPQPINITAFQDTAYKMTRVPPHLYHGSKGGKVPGKPRRNRKYPDGKPIEVVPQATDG